MPPFHLQDSKHLYSRSHPYKVIYKLLQLLKKVKNKVLKLPLFTKEGKALDMKGTVPTTVITTSGVQPHRIISDQHRKTLRSLL